VSQPDATDPEPLTDDIRAVFTAFATALGGRSS
jgi:hypothetical protein